MKRAITLLSAIAVSTALVIWLPTVKYAGAASPVVHAQDSSSRCSVASLNGPYALERQGTLVAPLPGFPALALPAPFGEVAIATFNGAGSFSGSAAVNIGGVVLNPVSFTATYTVNNDCTGTATVNTSVGLVLHNAIVVSGGGQRFIATETDPFEVVQTRAQKIGD